ncbi:hypothetical protein [Virgibacillus salexigens]|uniref:hypothetical protein n=1 Tax=Virgibacillus salexigens TaxID=61016 RepID=UPI001F281405|nr:hypothetical protein [Virgibacillus salexigens]
MYQWKISEYRKDKRVGALSPVKRSDYVQQLFDVGVGWNGLMGRQIDRRVRSGAQGINDNEERIGSRDFGGQARQKTD